jgi:hypothetical protein
MGGIHSGGDRSIGNDLTKADGAPQKPSDIGAAADAWDELLACIDPVMLRRVDGFQLRNLAELLHQSKGLAAAAMADPNDPKKTRSWLAVVDQIRKLSALFGLSPLDRCRLKITPQDSEPDEFQQWLARATA